MARLAAVEAVPAASPVASVPVVAAVTVPAVVVPPAPDKFEFRRCLRFAGGLALLRVVFVAALAPLNSDLLSAELLVVQLYNGVFGVFIILVLNEGVRSLKE